MGRDFERGASDLLEFYEAPCQRPKFFAQAPWWLALVFYKKGLGMIPGCSFGEKGLNLRPGILSFLRVSAVVSGRLSTSRPDAMAMVPKTPKDRELPEIQLARIMPFAYTFYFTLRFAVARAR